MLTWTIKRLFGRNGVSDIICIGDGGLEKAVCESLGAIWVKHKNGLLGRKWNAGFLAAGELDPDLYLFVGSSDWISDNWISGCKRRLTEPSIDGMPQPVMVGKLDMYLADIGMESRRMCYWPGYTQWNRRGEPIGIGRVLTRDIMVKLQNKPFDDDQDHSLDYTMYHNILRLKAPVSVIEDPSMKSLSISHHAWVNKHRFEDHYSGKLNSKIIDHPSDLINCYWDELYRIR